MLGRLLGCSLSLGCALFATGSNASGPFIDEPIPPTDSCTAIYSVQKRNCQVEHVYLCETPLGQRHRYDVWDAVDGFITTSIATMDGLVVANTTTNVEPFYAGILDIRKGFSLEELIQSGESEFDQTVATNMPPFIEPLPTKQFGNITFSGRKIEVDGVVLEELEEKTIWKVNALTLKSDAKLYLDRMRGTFLLGEIFLQGFGIEETSGGEPAQIIRPGETGFLDNRGHFDCGELSDAAPLVGGVQHG